MASTPVRAVDPDANARSTKKRVTPPSWGSRSNPDETALGHSPSAHSRRPTASIVKTVMTKAYVGTAKSRDDSLVPRKFATVSSTTNTSAISTRHSRSVGYAEVIAATPAATETATVNT